MVFQHFVVFSNSRSALTSMSPPSTLNINPAPQISIAEPHVSDNEMSRAGSGRATGDQVAAKKRRERKEEKKDASEDLCEG